MAAVLVGGVMGAAQRPRPPLAPAAAAPLAEPGHDIQVHVAGWVVSPGVVTLPDGALVADAVRAAGGLRLGARGDALNLAAPVTDGQQIVVPGPDHSPGEVSGSGATGLVSLNRATAADLETLPGVGPVLASRIVSYREENGPFQQVEDLLGVPGIGEAKLASIRDLVTVP